MSTEKFDPKMNTMVDYFTIEYSKYVGQQIYNGVPHLPYDEWIKQVPEVIKQGEEYQRYSLAAMNKGHIPLPITAWNEGNHHYKDLNASIWKAVTVTCAILSVVIGFCTFLIIHLARLK